MPAATIIFDLGKVIIDYDHGRACKKLSEHYGLDADDILRRIHGSLLERSFTAGLIDGARFTERVGQILGVKLDEQWLRSVWNEIFQENVEVSSLIRRLKPHHPLMILSNTNPWHWQYEYEHFAIVREIPTAVLSFKEGFLKPHPAIYRAALEKADPGSPAIFIDDIENNAAAATMMGIHGVHFQSAAQLERDLRALGCLLD